MNMYAGEKYLYGDSIVNKTLRTTAPEKMFVFYDIACQYMKHLKVGYEVLVYVVLVKVIAGLFNWKQKQDKYKGIRYSVPAFHVHSHGPSCVELLHPRKLKGFGNTDGEATERLWSDLGPYAKITKEMLSGNRMDVLEDALLFNWKRCARGTLGRLHRTLKALEKESESINLSVTETQITYSKYEELKSLERRQLSIPTPTTPELEYNSSIRQVVNTINHVRGEIRDGKSQLTGTHAVQQTVHHLDRLDALLRLVRSLSKFIYIVLLIYDLAIRETGRTETDSSYAHAGTG